jgi:hypothetical protein
MISFNELKVKIESEHIVKSTVLTTLLIEVRELIRVRVFLMSSVAFQYDIEHIVWRRYHDSAGRGNESCYASQKFSAISVVQNSCV